MLLHTVCYVPTYIIINSKNLCYACIHAFGDYGIRVFLHIYVRSYTNLATPLLIGI